MSEAARHFVLITRPEPAASATASLLRARGYAPLLAPMMQIQPAAAIPPGREQAVLVTSANALPALAHLPRSLPLLAVGDATAGRALAEKFENIRSASGDALALAGVAAAQLDPKDGPLLLASGAGQGTDLAALLRQRGFRIRRRVAYRRGMAESLPGAVLAALRAGHISHALFYSADTARAFLRCVRGAEDTLGEINALAISPQIAQALGAVVWHTISVAMLPNQDELLGLLP